jgi:hypothetical protein
VIRIASARASRSPCSRTGRRQDIQDWHGELFTCCAYFMA